MSPSYSAHVAHNDLSRITTELWEIPALFCAYDAVGRAFAFRPGHIEDHHNKSCQ